MKKLANQSVMSIVSKNQSYINIYNNSQIMH